MEIWRRKRLAPDLAARIIEMNVSGVGGLSERLESENKATALGRPLKDYSRLIVHSAAPNDPGYLKIYHINWLARRDAINTST